MSNVPMNIQSLEDTIESTDIITKEMLIGCLPDKRFKNAITEDVINLVNSETDSELRRIFRDNILSYTHVLTTGRFSVTAYINAVKFVSLKLMGNINSLAYAKVFPDRYYNLVQKGTSKSQIASFADNYAKNALVVKILEQTIIPTHILNANIYQEAINTQATLMREAKSDMVRMKAAECLINSLKPPEAAKVEIDVNYSNDIMEELRSTTRALAQQQKELIENKQCNAKDVAESAIFKKDSVIIDADYVSLDKDEEEHTSVFDTI